MGLDAQVGRHAGEDHFVDAALVQLEDEIVVFGSEYLAVVIAGIPCRSRLPLVVVESTHLAGCRKGTVEWPKLELAWYI